MKQTKLAFVVRCVASAGLTYMTFRGAGIWVAIAVGMLFLGQEVQGKAVQNLDWLFKKRIGGGDD